MLLSKSVALSILVSMGVQGMVIPSVGDVIDVFSLQKSDAKTESKEENVPCDKLHSKGKKLKNKKHKGKHVGKHNKKHGSKHSFIKSSDGFAPVFTSESNRDIIPHKYIIVMNDDVSADEVAFHQEMVALQHVNSLAGIDAEHPFFLATKDYKAEGGIVDSFDISNLLKGYSGYFLDETIEFIRQSPLVKFIEKDSMVYANEFNIEKGAPWGLARVSHREPLSLNSFNQYLYDTEGGAGVTSYVIDTGINIDHEEFGGRAKWGSTIPYGDADVDGNGHGTHCAGTIASEAYGIAKKAEVVAIKVLRSNGSGSMSDVVKGVEFAAKSHQDAAKEGKKGFKGSTANMSLGGGKSPALDLAVNAAVAAGIHFAVAAGNENQDACNTSPASAENAITVGASTIFDARAYFSNYGPCVDIFAPGLNILSTYIGSDSATATLSGTSMASPHIAGLLSYFVSLQPGADSEYFVSTKGVSTSQLKKNLIHYGTEGLLTDVPEDGTPNILAFNGAGHNLSKFWKSDVESTKSIVEDADKLVRETEAKIQDAVRDLEANPQNFFETVKELVDDAYNKFLD